LIATRPFGKLHIDNSGPRAPSAGGHRYFTLLVCDATGFNITALLKSNADACHAVIAVVEYVQKKHCKRGWKVARVHWDRDAVFHSSPMQHFFAERGITSGRT
jgi:hypothetical protein